MFFDSFDQIITLNTRLKAVKVHEFSIKPGNRMSEQRHRLAAIMPACQSLGASPVASLWQPKAGRFTDIVGYSALMQESEENALRIPDLFNYVITNFFRI
jgi:hypothetical protein